jgi:hypothetical protein
MHLAQHSQNNHPSHLASASLQLSCSVANLNVQFHNESLSFWGQGIPCRGSKNVLGPLFYCITPSGSTKGRNFLTSWTSKCVPRTHHSKKSATLLETAICSETGQRISGTPRLGDVADTPPLTSAPYHRFHPIRDSEWNTKRSAAGPHSPVIVEENVSFQADNGNDHQSLHPLIPRNSHLISEIQLFIWEGGSHVVPTKTAVPLMWCRSVWN